MKISIKCDYAVKAVLELGLNYKKGSLGTAKIARRQGIPKRFLEQLLLALKKNKIVTSYRGKEGGYSLIKDPDKITVREIIRAVEGQVDVYPRKKRTSDPVSIVWENVQSAVLETLDSVTVEDLIRKQKQARKVLTYSI